MFKYVYFLRNDSHTMKFTLLKYVTCFFIHPQSCGILHTFTTVLSPKKETRVTPHSPPQPLLGSHLLSVCVYSHMEYVHCFCYKFQVVKSIQELNLFENRTLRCMPLTVNDCGCSIFHFNS